MAKPGGYRSRSRGPATPVDPVAALHHQAVKLFDQGDGRAIDWPKAAEALFKAAFACLDEARGDDQALKVVRRVHDGAYNRLTGSPDSGAPYTPDLPARAMAGPLAGPAPSTNLGV